MIPVKPQIYKLEVYAVSQEEKKIKLNQNESPFDIPDKLKAEIWEELSQSDWNRYPPGEPRLLLKHISEYAGWPEDGILAGNGSNEMIQSVITACCRSGDRIVTVCPSFSVYKRVARILDIEVEEVPLKSSFEFDVDALAAAGRQARVMLLANPNNPTGTLISYREIESIAGTFPGLLVVDEAYWEFSGETALPLVRSRQNVVVLRTFSKALSLAGFRLGYLLGSPALTKQIGKVRLPFSVGRFQQVSGCLILKNFSFFRSGIRELIGERDRVYLELKRMPGLTPIPSRANFILFENRDRPAAEVYSGLYQKGILVRKLSDPRLAAFLRVSIGTRRQNDHFLAKIREIYTEETR